jgi:hypothetical protein
MGTTRTGAPDSDIMQSPQPGVATLLPFFAAAIMPLQESVAMYSIRPVAAAIITTVMLSCVASAQDQATPRTPPRTPTASAPASTKQGAQPRAQAPPRTPSRRSKPQASRGAVPRTPSGPSIVAPYYQPYRYGGARFSLGFYYGVPYFYPDYGYWYYSYPYPQYPPYYAWREPGVAFGSVRLDIPQKEASVVVDGYLVGDVGDFASVFNALDLPAGPHHIEVRAPGHETLAIDVYVRPHHTITYRGTLTPNQT